MLLQNCMLQNCVLFVALSNTFLPRNNRARCDIPPFAAHTVIEYLKQQKSTQRRHAIAYSAQKQHEKVTQFPPIILVHSSFVKPAAQLSNGEFSTTLRRALSVHNTCHSNKAQQQIQPPIGKVAPAAYATEATSVYNSRYNFNLRAD